MHYNIFNYVSIFSNMSKDQLIFAIRLPNLVTLACFLHIDHFNTPKLLKLFP